MNMVHLTAVPEQRRDRSKQQKRERILAAAARVLDNHGLDGFAVKSVAEEADVSVGTLFNYFASKTAVLVALRAHAVDTLRASYTNAQPILETFLDDEGVDADLRTLIPLCAFGGFWAAASVVLADEFHLQRALLSEPIDYRSTDELRQALPVVLRILEPPSSLLDHAVTRDLLEPHDNRERALLWIAALNGVLLLDQLAAVDRHLFRAPHLAEMVTIDLLVGWGADRADVEVATSHVRKLAAVAPLAPRPDGPGYRGPAT